MTPRRHIDLCSGVGGFALAASWAGYQTEVFCECDEFCQKVLRKHWPGVPIVPDLFDFDGRAYAGADLLTAGIPCQPYSCAGKQMGNDDDRALWPEARRIIVEVRPRWVVIENVAGFIGMALDGVLADLEAEGYECGSVVLPACAVNAPHRRDRVWVVAHDARARAGMEASCQLLDGRGNSRPGWRDEYSDGSEAMADARDPRLEERQEQPARAECQTAKRGGSITHPHRESPGRVTKPRRERGGGEFIAGLGRVADGLPARLDGHFDREPAIPRVASGIPQRAARLKALGNAIVPQVAYQILCRLSDP